MSRKTLEVAPEALDKYEEFHRYEPKKVGAFAKGFAIPSELYLAGDAKWVTYRSGKVDPESLEKPRRPVDYIHEHDAGVKCYLPAPKPGRLTPVPVPKSFREVEALVCLGKNLGFCFEHDGRRIEAQATSPLPELYCTPDGKALLVIQSHKTVLAMMWGGALGVFARGIDG